MVLSWVLKSIPRRHYFGASSSRHHRLLLLPRHLTSQQPGFYFWPNKAPSSSAEGVVETTFSDEKFYTHVLVKENGLSMLEAIDASVGQVLSDEDDDHIETTPKLPNKVQKLTARQLLLLGSIWYMPREQVEHNNNRSDDEPHSLIYKPQRLSISNQTMSLQAGDYLRIHHTPRRFTRVYEYDWREDNNGEDVGDDHHAKENRRRIVQRGNGFYIINKPPLVPVHATVDNCLENVVHQIEFHNPHQDYVVTTQRIDINTSGLLVVGTQPEFAAYFSSLLRRKTKNTLQKHNATKEDTANSTAPRGASMEKEYKCLVCIQDTKNSSTIDSWQRLKDLEDTVVRHYLEESERAPKRFEVTPPPIDEQEESGRKWYECLLKVHRVSPLIPIMETSDDCDLAQSLWAQEVTTSIPEGTRAVCEVDIQLLTGRTHQIRGQLAKLGYPIVGDEQYGGAIPKESKESSSGSIIGNENTQQLLALQCCQLGFWDADYKQVYNKKKKRDISQGVPSDRWISVTLNSAWWTEYLLRQTTSSTATSAIDAELVRQQKEKQRLSLSSIHDDEFANARMDLLPPTVQLSPGANKYVLIQVEGKDDAVYWFVVSASPGECGGPYHANVAQDTVEWIRAAGFQRITITGGGRIDYDPKAQRAHVYGFSYGFGKGDHAKVAELIDAHYKEGQKSDGQVKASFDDSDKLY